MFFHNIYVSVIKVDKYPYKHIIKETGEDIDLKVSIAYSSFARYENCTKYQFIDGSDVNLPISEL